MLICDMNIKNDKTDLENNSWKIHTLCCYNYVYTLVRLIYGTHCELCKREYFCHETP